MLTFEWWWAAFLLPLPLFWYKNKNLKQDNGVVLEAPFAHEFNTRIKGKQFPNWKLCMLTCAWLFFILSLAKPIWRGDLLSLPISGRDIMLAVDLSGSMNIADFEYKGQMLNRLQAIKVVASEFIERRTNDKIGLILFGDQAYLQTPLTFDKKTVTRLLLESEVGLAGQRTAIGDAIGLAIKKLAQQSQDKVLILLTDGANTAGELSPLKAAQIAQNYHLKIYTIGIGAKDIVVRGPFGTTKVNSEAELDEKTLTQIANITGGQYFRATDLKSLESIYHQIDQFEPTASVAKHYRPQKSLFYYPLLIALLLILLCYVPQIRRGAYA